MNFLDCTRWLFSTLLLISEIFRCVFTIFCNVGIQIYIPPPLLLHISGYMSHRERGLRSNRIHSFNSIISEVNAIIVIDLRAKNSQLFRASLHKKLSFRMKY